MEQLLTAGEAVQTVTLLPFQELLLLLIHHHQDLLPRLRIEDMPKITLVTLRQQYHLELGL